MALKLYDVIRKDQKDKENAILDEKTYDQTPVRERISREGREGSPHSNWRNILVFGLALIFLSGLYILGAVFVHATVTVTQRQIPFSLQDTQLDVANENSAVPGRLSFQTMVVTDSVTRQVFGSAMTTSTTKATGTAVIFNQYSKSGQTVRSGTTLTGANGEKYLTQKTVTVPGYTGTAKTAGTVSVPIVAAAAGPAYNSNGTTFTISGWSGANAKLFFGTSGAISGGQNGATHTLSDSDKASTLTTLQEALTEKLSRETHAQIPDNLVTFPDLQFTSIDTASTVLSGPDIQFPATMTGTMVSYLIPKDLLEQAIASKAITDQMYPNVTIPDLGGITVSAVSALPADPSNTPDSITISVSGQGTIITEVPQATVQQDVLGIRRGLFTSALSGIPEIDTAKYSLMPFWAPYFPYKPSRITIKVQ
jgi:hypothetical protein